MARSMTGFGRGEAQNEQIHFVVEIKTVNHRFFEPTIRLSRRFASMENDLRTQLGESIVRGKTDVSVTYEELESSAEIKLHEDALEQYLSVLRAAGDKFGLKDNLQLSNVLSFPDVLEITQAEADEEAIYPVLREAAADALKKLNEMRDREGERITNDLLAKAEELKKIVALLKESEPIIEANYRAKMTGRIQEILDRMGNGVKPDPGILENEIALFADRVCIDEELVRLTSHIDELENLLSKSEPVGRQLDFLLQEFNRESNTIASKAGDLSVTQQALLLKKEIEKIREQIQNLE